jgi:hypothetical protein
MKLVPGTLNCRLPDKPPSDILCRSRAGRAPSCSNLVVMIVTKSEAQLISEGFNSVWMRTENRILDIVIVVFYAEANRKRYVL